MIIAERLVSVVLALTSLATMFAQEPDSALLDKISMTYREAQWPSRAMRETITPTRARSLLKAPGLTRDRRMAIHYYLACVTGSPNEVTRMVALRGDEALPEALGTIYDHNRNRAALRYLMDLRLDGGPAETLAGVRFDLCVKHPDEIGQALRARCGTVKGALKRDRDHVPANPFVLSLVYEVGEDGAKRAKLLAVIRRASGKGAVFLGKVIEGL